MITKDLAHTISTAAIKAARKKEFDLKWKALVDTSTALYIAQFGPANMATMKALPESWFTRRFDFGVRFDGQRRTLHFALGYGASIPPFRTDYGELMRVPNSDIADDFQSAPVELKQPFADAYDAYHGFKDEIAKLREKTEATLRAFRNLKVLAEQWPEMVPYIPTGLPITRAPSTALFNPASLNAAIGLPPK